MADGVSEHAGTAFQAQPVVDNYRFRPPYPAQLYQRLVASLPPGGWLLDIGCGPGQIARNLSRYCDRVVAVDPSLAMLALARSLEHGQAANIDWLHGKAEDAELGSARFAMVVAANSIHWMETDRLFARLKNHVARQHCFAVISGDDAHDPAWRADWVPFLVKWIPIATGERFDLERKSAEWSAYKHHLDIELSQTLISSPQTQSVADFIACQHSRDAFAPARLGERMAEFDAELRELLVPHADSQDRLRFCTKSELTAGRLRGI